MDEAPNKTFAGDIELIDCTITSPNGTNLNVLHQVVGIELFEDIFAPFITGKLILKDALDIPNTFPLVGEETLRLRFRTPALPIEQEHAGNYLIFKMDDWVKSAERELIYVLHFTSLENLIDANKKISKTYSGKVSTIINKIVTDPDALESGKPFNYEEASNTTKYISNFWSPIQNIMYLVPQAQTATQSPSFVFFENRNGFAFVSLEALYTGPTYQNFIWDNYSADISGGTSTTDIAQDYKRIFEYSVPQNFNYIERLKSGAFGSQMITYDITTKKYAHVGYLPEFDKEAHLNPFFFQSKFLLKQSRAVLHRDNKYFNNFSGYGDVTNTSTYQRRMHLISSAEASKIEIVVPGRSDYTVGQKVTVRLPIHASIDASDSSSTAIDKMLSGNYVIAALCHKISRDRHECVLQLIKDSLILDLNNVKRV